MIDDTIRQFIQDTASESPVPGGGSVSALCGALAAALGRMVCGLTAGRKKYAEVEAEVNDLAHRIDPYIHNLSEAVDLDAQAYDTVFRAYKLPKDTEADKLLRQQTIQSALRRAAAVPLQVVVSAADLAPILERLAAIGNRNAVTDIYVASLCARTAALGAGANVRINLASMTDPDTAADMRQTLEQAEAAVILSTDRTAAAILPLLQ